jgi:hypothetical protein
VCGAGSAGLLLLLPAPSCNRGGREYRGSGGVGVRIGIAMGRPSCGRGTISGGCKYHTGIANTILGNVSVAATWKASTPGGG